MGWIILALLLVLLLLPFLIPVRVLLRLDESTRDWALYFGLFQLAPDTTRRLEVLRVKVVRWTRVPLFILLSLGQGLLLPFQLLFLLFKAIAKPFQKVAHWQRERRSAKRSASSARIEPPEPADVEEPQEATGLESPGEEGRIERREPAHGMEVDEGSGEEEENSAPDDELSQPDSPWDLPDEDVADDTSEEPPPPPPPRPESSSDREKNEEARSGEDGQGIFGGLRAAFDRVGSIREMIDLYLGYVREYSPLAKKILRRVFRFLGRCMRAFRFRTFDAHLQMGGDPATLGAMLGWHHALAASIHPSVPHHLVFEPDYDSEELAPHGTLDLELVIWPYRFLLPTLLLVVTMPWWSIYKVVRNHRKQDSA
ncbi:hypothetical protein KQI63_15330 [bacterium]|nr:hypothetical protein [bacterium]